MDQFIENDGRTIDYKVVDNYSEKPVVRKGVERIGRYIHYYDEKGEFIKMERIYGEYDDMQNISAIVAKRHFENNLKYQKCSDTVLIYS